MSFWSNLPLHIQRHHVLEAARKYRRCETALAAAWGLLQEAQTAAKALGVSVAPNPGVASRDLAYYRIRLPQEAVMENAKAAMASARRELYDALEECPAVLSEVFAMLGCP